MIGGDALPSGTRCRGWVNPLNQNFPRADPLPKALLSDYKEAIADYERRLDSTPVAAMGVRQANPQ